MPTATVASATTEARRVAVARRWFALLGHAPRRERGMIRVVTPDYPTTWDANFAYVETGALSTDVIAHLADEASNGRWQVVCVDTLAPTGMEDALAAAGFTAAIEMVEMLTANGISPTHALPDVMLCPVAAANDWRVLEDLVRADHAEGKRTGMIDDAVRAGLIAAMHRRTPPGRYHLIRHAGETVGYGQTLACPGALGLIEDLFTLPEWRGRGVMSAFIVAAALALRAEGCDALFLGAHADADPRRLYRRLGFVPVATATTWVRQNLT